MSDEERLTIDDIIRAGGCARGLRGWFSSRGGHANGVDMRTFLRDGITIEEAKKLNDGLVNRAIELKERDRGRR